MGEIVRIAASPPWGTTTGRLVWPSIWMVVRSPPTRRSTAVGVVVEVPSAATAWIHSSSSPVACSGSPTRTLRSRFGALICAVDAFTVRIPVVSSIPIVAASGRPAETTLSMPNAGGPASTRYSTTVRGANEPRRHVSAVRATIVMPMKRATPRSSGSCQIHSPNEMTASRYSEPIRMATIG